MIQFVFLEADNALFDKIFPAAFFQENFPSNDFNRKEKMHIIDNIAKKIKKKINNVIVKGSKQ